MPPQVIAYLTYAFILWLFCRDVRQRAPITFALWVPVLWFLLLATRHPSQWLAIWGIHGFETTSLEEGSNLDATIYLSLILLGLAILIKRRTLFGEVARYCPWIVVFLLYCLLATTWAEYPYVALKRWIKILGHPVMALVILTEPEPITALRRFIYRSAYVILPISILWIKYFPHLGRKAGGWATQSANTGITTGKNLLGNDCLILGLFLFWFLIQVWTTERGKTRSKELYLIAGLTWMNLWCLLKASSMTSWLALIGGAAAMVLVRYQWLRRRIGTYSICLALAITVAQQAFDIFGLIAQLRGKDDTAEGRGNLWSLLLEEKTNPLIGVGFESFWIGERLARIWALPEFTAWKPNEAHNGYLEIYLTLGAMGLLILAGLVSETYKKCRYELSTSFDVGRFRLGVLMAILAYNWMEAAFRGLSVVFFTFFLLSLMPRALQRSLLLRSTSPDPSDSEMTLAPGSPGAPALPR